jgi:hypothetical protein
MFLPRPLDIEDFDDGYPVSQTAVAAVAPVIRAPVIIEYSALAPHPLSCTRKPDLHWRDRGGPDENGIIIPAYVPRRPRAQKAHKQKREPSVASPDVRPIQPLTDLQRRRLIAGFLIKRDGIKGTRTDQIAAFLAAPNAYAKTNGISLTVEDVVPLVRGKDGKWRVKANRPYRPTTAELALLLGRDPVEMPKRRKARRASYTERAENDAANVTLTMDEFAITSVHDTFMQRLPLKVLSGNDHKLDKTYRRRVEAITKRYIALNDDTELRWMLFDMDRPKDHVGPWDVRTWWRERGAPEPNVIVVNPETGNGKYLYALAKPITTTWNNGRKEIVQWFQAIRRGLTRRLRADTGYRGGTCRNPLFAGHEAVWSDRLAYTLADLNEGLTKEEKAREFRTSETHGEGGSGMGRNATMFDALCQHGYGRVAQFKAGGGTESEWHAILASLAGQINTENGDDPLPGDEVNGLVGRVSRWHWNAYASQRKVENQAKAGRIRAEKRREAIDKVIDAVDTIEAPRAVKIEKVMTDLGVSKARAKKLTAAPRAEYVMAASSKLKDWELYGLPKATFYRWKKDGTLEKQFPNGPPATRA